MILYYAIIIQMQGNLNQNELEDYLEIVKSKLQ